MKNESAAKPLFGLVLAGGESRRMGQDKASLRREGQSQLAYTVRLLDDLVERVFVSTRADQQNDAVRSRFKLIIDRYEGMGPVAGILSAMDEYPGVDWLVLACDLPNIDAATLLNLLEKRSADKPFSAYVSSNDDLPEPLCAVYTAQSSGIVRGFVEDGVHCPRKILIRSDTLLLRQPNPSSLENVNTPDDLRRSILGVST
ncbi:MAG: NTP transferase domain-containing protein [Woeseiaceae bacterium]